MDLVLARSFVEMAGLRLRVDRRRVTVAWPPRTVLAQRPEATTYLEAGDTVRVTISKAPRCHPSYRGACLKPFAGDYDCVGGSGNGPNYTGPVQVVGPDVFDLDRDGDGIGCE